MTTTDGLPTVDLEEIGKTDGLEGHWWHYIRHDFAFAKTIGKEKAHAVPVSNNSILVHKQRVGDDRYPTTRYHLIWVNNGDAEVLLFSDSKEIRKIMRENLIAYINTHHTLPWGCEYYQTKVVKEKDIVQIKYKPIPIYMEFLIPIIPSEDFCDDAHPDGLTCADIEVLKASDVNELGRETKTTDTIVRVDHEDTIRRIAENNEWSVCVFDAKVTQVDTRKSTYQEHETIWYLIHVENGTAAPDKKKSTLRRPFTAINVKCSYNAMKESQLKADDRISFCGQLKEDPHLGLIIQNVRKFEK